MRGYANARPKRFRIGCSRNRSNFADDLLRHGCRDMTLHQNCGTAVLDPEVPQTARWWVLMVFNETESRSPISLRDNRVARNSAKTFTRPNRHSHH
jgi:hypothetical protein